VSVFTLKLISTTMHATMCDQAYLNGPPKPIDSYLVIDNYLEIVDNPKSDTFNPGYGNKSENIHFIERLNKKDITFVGPPAEAIRRWARKWGPKNIMEN